MTRINTNVSSLQAQINLSRNNEDLQTALTRLSTGLRINSGKDDPAGLIASETLRSDIKATEVGISNSELANQMIATADSALGQVSSLLVDIRGLVNEAANSGALSASQIEANQLQVDSSIAAIDRISQTTQFQGNRLLDGSLDFTTMGVDSSSVSSVQVNQASFGTNPTLGVNVELVSQATKGELTYSGGQNTDALVLQVGGSEGYQMFNFEAGTSVTDMASAINLVSEATGVTAAAEGVLEWTAGAGVNTVASYGTNNDVTITANTAGEVGGAYYVRYFQETGVGVETTANITEATGTAGDVTYGYIDVNLGTTAATAAEYADVTADMDAATRSAGGTFDAADFTAAGAGPGTINWVPADGDAGYGAMPPVQIDLDSVTELDGPGSGTADYDAETNTFTVDADDGDSIAELLIYLNRAIADSITEDGIQPPYGYFTSTGTDGTLLAATVGPVEGTDETPGTNGVEAGFTLNAVADTAGTAADTDFSIKFVNTGGTDGYSLGVYTIVVDNDGGVFSMTSDELVDALNAIGDGVHTFNNTGSAGTEKVYANVQGGDWTPDELTDVASTTAGFDGGTAGATGNAVVDAINAAQDLMIDNEEIDARIFTVTNATGSDGSGVVGISEVMATTGSDPTQNPTANNMVQFQALDGMRDISYVAAGKSTALSIDLNTYAPEYANAAAIIDLGIANGTFKLESNVEGEAGNQDINISWTTDDEDAVSWDAGTNTLEITIDNDDATTLQDVMDLINSETDFTATTASAEVEPGSGIPDVGDPTQGAITSAVVTAGLPEEASLTGGVVSKGTMVVNLATDADGNVTTTANDLIAFIEASDEQVLKDFELQAANGGASEGTGVLEATTTNVKFDVAGTTYADAQASGSTHAALGSTAQFTVTAQNEGTAYDGVLVRVVEDADLTEGTGAVTFLEDSNTLRVSYNGDYTANQVVELINTETSINSTFKASATAGVGLGTANVSDGDFVRLSGGETQTVPDGEAATGTAGGPMTMMVGNLDAGSDISDAMLTFNAANYGSSSFASVKAITGTFAVTNAAGATVDQAYGTDVLAMINGLTAVGDGLNASLSTASLQVQLGINASMTAGETSSFSVTGGGAQFQLGPDVVSNQQARIGIMSVSSATLGGINGHGRLYQLADGESFSLSSDTTGAAAIVEDVITQVTGIRGQLGAFQKTTLETNIASLQDTLETLTAAESSIRDADFAEESSALTRAQILVQSGTKVLSIANQQPQNVLSLIQ